MWISNVYASHQYSAQCVWFKYWLPDIRVEVKTEVDGPSNKSVDVRSVCFHKFQRFGLTCIVWYNGNWVPSVISSAFCDKSRVIVIACSACASASFQKLLILTITFLFLDRFFLYLHTMTLGWRASHGGMEVWPWPSDDLGNWPSFLDKNLKPSVVTRLAVLLLKF